MQRTNRAFTLVELVVVVVVLAILAAAVAPKITSAQKKARDSRRMSDLKAVQQALEDYHSEFGAYPSTGSQWWGDAPNYGGKDYRGDNAYIPNFVPDYMSVLPKDPDPQYPSGSRGYLYRSNGANYKFLAYYTPETFSEENPFYDPTRPNGAWQVSSPGGYNW